MQVLQSFIVGPTQELQVGSHALQVLVTESAYYLILHIGLQEPPENIYPATQVEQAVGLLEAVQVLHPYEH